MIRGTNHDQDARFVDKTKRMLEKSQWPDKYDIKVDLKKVDYELIKVWIERRITQLLGEEDDIVSGTIISHLDQHLERQQKLNAKQLHVAISGVLQEKTLTFMSELWDVLDEAQRSSRGIPQCLIEEKKKSEQSHRKKLDEIQQKRHKMNVNRFNQTVRGEEFSGARYEHKDSEFKSQRDNQAVNKKKKNKDRSRSKSRQKKHRSRSFQKKKRERSRQIERKRNRQKRNDFGASPRHKMQNKKEKRRRNSESDSSGVVSSSNSIK